MPTRRTLLAAAAVAGLACSPALAQQARTPITMWIGVTGPAQEEIMRYAQEFNASQTQFEAKVEFRGQYPEQRAAAFAAFRAGNPPHIMQMFDAGTGDMFALPRATIPVSEVMQRAGVQFDPASYIGPARGYYSRPDGTMNSLPFNVSTAVMFINNDIFTKAGLDPSKPPRTWPEVIAAANQIRERNAAECGFTTTWLAWTMLEQYSAIHDLPLSTEANGRGGLNAVLNFNDAPRARMIQTLVDASRNKAFQYGGRSNDANALFVAGTCAMLIQSSGGHAAIARDLKAKFSVAPMPFWPDVLAEPKNSIVGGASLWVFNAPNRSAEELRGVAQFLAFLARPETYVRFAKATGFLPATNAAFQAMQAEGFFQQNAGRDVPILQLTRGTPTANSSGYRFGRWTEIRDMYHEEVERALQGQQTAQAALDNTVRRGNDALRQFERSVGAAN
ncbi:extracellular solute-binding protein [Phreatobacter sp.]|uniref:extracellular solute-binding protein n=1 Tax=Phreatobacter sp. TaxID=1966341 RepID=UPI0025E8F7A3|nr:extracellular solute-binding protein [Phreatobacter sp.]